MGHNGTGKTSLAESILYYSKITDRIITKDDKGLINILKEKITDKSVIL